MLSTEQLLNEGHYGPVTPSSSSTDTLKEKTDGANDLSKFVGPNSERPDLGDVLAWTGQLLEAVHLLHTNPQPIIHTGIAPSAIMLNADGTVHLQTIREATPTGSADPLVNYKPLELLWDSLDQFSQRAILNRYDDEAQRWLTQPPTPASDIYSVGATIYAVLTGTPPPDALDRSIAAMEDKKDPLVPPSILVPSIPPEISDVVVKAMAVNRDERYYSAVILRQVFKTAAVRVRERLDAALSQENAPLVENAAMPAAPEPPIEVAASFEHPTTAVKIEAKRPDVPMAETPLDDVLEVPVISRPPVIKDIPEVARPSDEIADTEPAFLSTISDDVEKPSRSKMPLIAGAFVLVLLAVGAGVYKFAGSAAPVAPSETNAPALQTVNQPAVETKAPDISPAAEQPANPVPGDVPIETPAHSDVRVKQNKLPAAAPQAEPAKKAPAPAKSPTKKQVTVDDLINDH